MASMRYLPLILFIALASGATAQITSDWSAITGDPASFDNCFVDVSAPQIGLAPSGTHVRVVCGDLLRTTRFISSSGNPNHRLQALSDGMQKVSNEFGMALVSCSTDYTSCLYARRTASPTLPGVQAQASP